MISLSSSGSFDNTERFLRQIKDGNIFSQLTRFGQEGVNALAAATPKESGETANAWSFEIKKESGSWSIIWSNNHVVDGAPIAVMLQHGHGTGTGGYVEGRDYINPALSPVFDRIAEEAWRVVTTA